MRKLLPCLLMTGSLGAILISFVFVYFNMIGLEPAFYKAFFTDLVSFSVVPQLLAVSFLISGVTVLKKAETTLVTMEIPEKVETPLVMSRKMVTIPKTAQKMVTTPETALTMEITLETMEPQATTVMPETMEMMLTEVQETAIKEIITPEIIPM